MSREGHEGCEGGKKAEGFVPWFFLRLLRARRETPSEKAGRKRRGGFRVGA